MRVYPLQKAYRNVQSMRIIISINECKKQNVQRKKFMCPNEKDKVCTSFQQKILTQQIKGFLLYKRTSRKEDGSEIERKEILSTHHKLHTQTTQTTRQSTNKPERDGHVEVRSEYDEAGHPPLCKYLKSLLQVKILSRHVPTSFERGNADILIKISRKSLLAANTYGHQYKRYKPSST